MTVLSTYLREMSEIRASGEATDETSYYAPLANLLNATGGALRPPVHCVVTPKNRGAGIPDGALFIRKKSVLAAGERAIAIRAPERGAIEVKGAAADLDAIARSSQVHRYLRRYGQVLVTNYREFLQLRLDEDERLVKLERFSIAEDEAALWKISAEEAAAVSEPFEAFLARVLLADAPLSSPADVAWFLAAYARTADGRLQQANDLPALRTLRGALEDALEVKFAGERGEELFRSTLIQTLFYGVFAAWITWSKAHRPSADRFSWRTAQWTLNVPMVRVLFAQLTTPSNLPADLDEVLDWTEDLLARVDSKPFLEAFETREAIEHFYEPFLQAYDPRLRKDLGVWYTPPEVVRYIVARVHEALQRDLQIPLGLADDRVHVLDPCTGTGSFLVETLSTIIDVLDEHHQDSLVAQQAKEAALTRLHGFELLPAPFVIAHLQVGMLLAEAHAPLDATKKERASIYLTNALTGWANADEKMLPFEEFQSEREAAGTVKRKEPILVVLGNPPYNGYAGLSDTDEQNLLSVYKQGLSRPPWEITKNKLDDYYVRFFRIAERRIAEATGRGIVCFISNSGYLGDPSAVVMRKHLIGEFDRIYIDNLNGDSRETGKKTPEGLSDPSVFATKLSPGIQVGTAVSLLVRTDAHQKQPAQVVYRDFWGATKRADLEASLAHAQTCPPYEELQPSEANWHRLRRWQPRAGYEAWPNVLELAASRPELGLNENRGESLVAIDRDELTRRMQHVLDSRLTLDQLDKRLAGGLLEAWGDYDVQKTRKALLDHSPYDESHLMLIQVRPMDVRWAYVDKTPKLWNRSRPGYVAAARIGSESLLVRRRAPRALDGAAIHLSANIVDQHVLHKDAYALPLVLPADEADAPEGRLFSVAEHSVDRPWRANLSVRAHSYLRALGYQDADVSRTTARLIWLHALAIGYASEYLEENADAVRNGWPRVPLPGQRQLLEESAQLGARIAALVDIDTPLPGLDVNPEGRVLPIATLTRSDGGVPQSSDLNIECGWGVTQVRVQKSGATSRIVMPGEGRVEDRVRSHLEVEALRAEDHELLGERVLDVYLNDTTFWSGVPEPVWSYKIGGYQVLRKWLGYRESSVLERPLTRSEARQFQSIARRLTELVRMSSELNDNYRTCVGVVSQDPLPFLSEQSV